MILPRGTIVVDELILPITDTYLERGRIYVTALVRGPIRDVNTIGYVVYGRDGEQVWSGVNKNNGGAPIVWSNIGPGTSVFVSVSLSVEGKQAVR